jgi:hypothetical protein
LVSGERAGFRIRDSGFREGRSWRSPGFWGKGRIQDSGFRNQGRAIMVVAWFLGKGQDSGFGIQDSGKGDHGGRLVSGERRMAIGMLRSAEMVFPESRILNPES